VGRHEFHQQEVTAMSVECPGEARQIQQEPPLPAALPVLDIQDRPPISISADAPPGVRQPAVVTKLQVLLRAHQVARRAEWRRWLTRAALLLAAVAGSFGLGAGAHEITFERVYDSPDRHAQRYQEGWPVGTTYAGHLGKKKRSAVLPSSHSLSAALRKSSPLRTRSMLAR
jgi:hypothetical protein